MKEELIDMIKYIKNINTAKAILLDVYNKLSYCEFAKNRNIHYELKEIIETLENLINDTEYFIDEEEEK